MKFLPSATALEEPALKVYARERWPRIPDAENLIRTLWTIERIASPEELTSDHKLRLVAPDWPDVYEEDLRACIAAEPEGYASYLDEIDEQGRALDF